MTHSLFGRVLLVLSCIVLPAFAARAADPWLVFQGKEGPGKGKHIVLMAGDEEYRSEEGLPMLAKLLAKNHGFKCTCLFSIDPKTGEIDNNQHSNTPGIEALQSADLLVILTRFRDLPDEQMKYVDEYVKAGKPIVGLRTATHAFNIGKGKTYEKYSYNFGGKDYKDGFGRQIFGETWVSHHGDHGKQSTRGVIPDSVKGLPILRGVSDIWGTTDVYGIRNLPENTTPLVMGQVLSGMNPTDAPAEGKKNDPMMPVSWVRTYKSEDGNKEGRVFATTMGAATDLKNEGLRRLVVNACYWAVGLEDKIPEKNNVEIVGPYEPRNFGFNGGAKGVTPDKLKEGAEDLVAPSGAPAEAK